MIFAVQKLSKNQAHKLYGSSNEKMSRNLVHGFVLEG